MKSRLTVRKTGEDLLLLRLSLPALFLRHSVEERRDGRHDAVQAILRGAR